VTNEELRQTLDEVQSLISIHIDRDKTLHPCRGDGAAVSCRELKELLNLRRVITSELQSRVILVDL